MILTLKYELVCFYEKKNAFSVFVSLGTLERHETGETAKAILSAIEDSEYLVPDALLPVSQESKRNKNAGYKHSSFYKYGMVSYNLTHTEKSSDKVRRKSKTFLQSNEL